MPYSSFSLQLDRTLTDPPPSLLLLCLLLKTLFFTMNFFDLNTPGFRLWIRHLICLPWFLCKKFSFQNIKTFKGTSLNYLRDLFTGLRVRSIASMFDCMYIIYRVVCASSSAVSFLFAAARGSNTHVVFRILFFFFYYTCAVRAQVRLRWGPRPMAAATGAALSSVSRSNRAIRVSFVVSSSSSSR